MFNGYASPDMDFLDKMATPALYVTRLKAIASKAYALYTNENPAYINAVLNPSNKPHNSTGES